MTASSGLSFTVNFSPSSSACLVLYVWPYLLLLFWQCSFLYSTHLWAPSEEWLKVNGDMGNLQSGLFPEDLLLSAVLDHKEMLNCKYKCFFLFKHPSQTLTHLIKILTLQNVPVCLLRHYCKPGTWHRARGTKERWNEMSEKGNTAEAVVLQADSQRKK